MKLKIFSKNLLVGKGRFEFMFKEVNESELWKMESNFSYLSIFYKRIIMFGWKINVLILSLSSLLFSFSNLKLKPTMVSLEA